MKKQKISIKMLIITLLLIIIFSISIITMSIENEETSQIVSSTNLSNKKIGWGIKRNNNHQQPDLGKENRKILLSANLL